MRPRSELLVAIGVFLGLALLALAAGRTQRGNVSTDYRTSSDAAGPAGTRALAEVIERAGGRVTRWRDRLRLLPDDLVQDATVGVVQPPQDLSDDDVSRLLSLTDRKANLLLAGAGVLPVLRCLGYRLEYSLIDSARVRGPSGQVRRGVTTTFVRDTIARRAGRGRIDEQEPCPAVPIAATDTILRTVDSAAVVLRLRRAGTRPARSLLLVSDAAVIGNAGLGTPELPELVIRELLTLSRHVVFDEYHHAGARGSMWRPTLAWSRASPWGWVLWQLAIVGLLAFLSGAVRFGPVRRAIVRERRSPLEHVRALATALAASNGHDVAIGALVRGLQRRLAAVGGESSRRVPGVTRGDWKPWVDRLAERMPGPRARARAEHMASYAARGQPDNAVRETANAVEDVWEALHR